jgi:SulP family sulfate permease
MKQDCPAKPGRRRLPHRADLPAALTTALVTIPDAMASAILAGLNPIHGLYAVMVGTPIAALVTSSEFMYAANTGAIAVATGSALEVAGGSDPLRALVTLTIMVGIVQLLLGLLRLGGILRFVSNAVMTGFMSGIGVLIVLSQLGELTGYHSHLSNKLLAALDLFRHLPAIDARTTTVGLCSIALIFGLHHTPLRRFSLIIALAAASVAVALLGWEIERVSDVAEIPRSFPAPLLPDLSLVAALVPGAVGIALIGLIQAAGVSKTIPNPDGSFPDVSRDFTGQGAANIAAGCFRGMPIGGTMSETAVNIGAGARSRWANICSGLIVIALVLLAAPLVGFFAMPAIAALLVVAGLEAIKLERIADVWRAGWMPALTMLVTFVATLAVPIQWAVLLGVILSVALYLHRTASDVRLKAIRVTPQGLWEEIPCPRQLAENSVTVLQLYGSVFYASTDAIIDALPDSPAAGRAAVVLTLRSRSELGSTFLDAIDRYARQLAERGGRLFLAGLHPEAMKDLTRTTAIPRDSLFAATALLGESASQARDAASAWLEAAAEEGVKRARGGDQ